MTVEKDINNGESGDKDDDHLDSDIVSYQEMKKGILIERGHMEANFRIYFKVGVNLKILHSDKSSIKFGECTRNNGEVHLFVAHGEGINFDFVPFDGSDLNIDEKEGVQGKDNDRDTEMNVDIGNANSLGVGLDDIEDDDLGFGEIDCLIDENSSSKYYNSIELDDPFYEYDGASDDSENDELFVARENLRKAAEKKSDLKGLSRIVKEIDIAKSNLK
ncbi:hypothetical protein ACFE04_020901 [Oxalis oulophora]